MSELIIYLTGVAQYKHNQHIYARIGQTCQSWQDISVEPSSQ